MWGQCGLEGGPTGIEKMRDQHVWGGGGGRRTGREK